MIYAVSERDRIVPLSDFPPMDSGAPLPAVSKHDAELTLTYTRQEGSSRAHIRFDRVLAYYVGWPNDEALSAHPLFGRGLGFYGAFRVTNSSWIEGIKVANRVHRQHADAMFDKWQHIIVTFHDEIFECIATSYSIAT